MLRIFINLFSLNKEAELIASDLTRYVGRNALSFRRFIKTYRNYSGFQFCFWFRLCGSNNKFIRKVAIYQHRRLSRCYFLDIPFTTNIGPGLYIGHGRCVVVHPTAKIGSNVNLSQFCTIGANEGNAAVIGSSVYIGPSVCVIGNVDIGDGAQIGAGSVVTKSIPNYSVAAGVPAKVIRINSKADNKYIKNPFNK